MREEFWIIRVEHLSTDPEHLQLLYCSTTSISDCLLAFSLVNSLIQGLVCSYLTLWNYSDCNGRINQMDLHQDDLEIIAHCSRGTVWYNLFASLSNPPFKMKGNHGVVKPLFFGLCFKHFFIHLCTLYQADWTLRTGLWEQKVSSYRLYSTGKYKEPAESVSVKDHKQVCKLSISSVYLGTAFLQEFPFTHWGK